MQHQEIIENYIKDLGDYQQPITIQAIKGILNNFAKDRDILKVGKDDIKMWLRELDEKVSVQTKKKYLEKINVFYEHLIEENLYTDKNPCKKHQRNLRKTPTLRVRETTILEPEDVRKIVVKASNPRDRSMVLIFYKTGMRLSELQQLQVEDINLEEKIITIRKRKGGKKGDVLFDDECKRWLKAYLSIRRIENNSLYDIGIYRIEDIIRENGIKAGFPKLNPHDFRHAFTSHLNNAKCHPEVIRMLRGDSSINMVSYYTHFSMDKNREEYEMCIPKLGV